MRLRQKNGWMFRGGNGYTEKEGPRSNSKKRQSDATGASQNSGDEEGHSGPNSGRPNYQAPSNPTASVHTPQRLLRRQEMQARSDQLLATRKRRRRIKGHAGMGPDPPGPPRFPSETTLDESKAFLHLTNAHYQGVRAQFQAMCEETGVTRKAATPPEQWTAIKARLVNEHEHLHREFYGAWNGVPQEQKELALDAICMSVTKLMRTAGKHITIAEAKRILNLNPNDARVIRNEFYEVLRRDHFISKYECGEEHWNELKALWEASSSIVGQSLGAGSDAQKRKAVDRLASDVMKRYRDDLTKVSPDVVMRRNDKALQTRSMCIWFRYKSWVVSVSRCYANSSLSGRPKLKGNKSTRARTRASLQRCSKGDAYRQGGQQRGCRDVSTAKTSYGNQT